MRFHQWYFHLPLEFLGVLHSCKRLSGLQEVFTNEVAIPFPALVSILFSKLGNLLLVQSYLQWPQPRSQMHGSGTAAHLLLSGF